MTKNTTIVDTHVNADLYFMIYTVPGAPLCNVLRNTSNYNNNTDIIIDKLIITRARNSSYHVVTVACTAEPQGVSYHMTLTVSFHNGVSINKWQIN